MATATARPTTKVSVIESAGVGLIATALCLAGALISLDRFRHGATSATSAVSWSVAWFVANIAAAAVLTNGASRTTRAIDIRRATLVYFLFCFGLLAVGWRHRPESASELINQDGLPVALLVSQVAVTAWALGFRFLQLKLLGGFMSHARSNAAPNGAWRLRSPLVPLLLYLPSAASTAYRLQNRSFAYLADTTSLIGSPGNLGPLLEFSDKLGKAAIVVAIISVLTERSTRLLAIAVLAVVTAAELGIGAFSGTKTPFILLGVAIAVPLFARRRRMSWKVVGAALAILAVGTSFTGSYRERLIESGGRLRGQEAFDAFTKTVSETLQPAALSKAVVDGGAALGTRLRQIDNVAIIVQRTPSEIPYRPTADLVLDPARQTVPRVLWPGKPTITTGLDFSRTYYRIPTVLITASAVTVIGDLYRHGGIAVVIIGMGLLGATVRLVDDEWHPSRDIRLGVLYVSVFLTLVNLESDLASILTSLPFAVLSGVIASKLAFRQVAGSES